MTQLSFLQEPGGFVLSESNFSFLKSVSNLSDYRFAASKDEMEIAIGTILDLAITDVTMLLMDGFELCHKCED